MTISVELKDMLMRMYDVNQSTAESMIDILEVYSDNLKKEFMCGVKKGYQKDCDTCYYGRYNDHLRHRFCYVDGECNNWEKWRPKDD